MRNATRFVAVAALAMSVACGRPVAQKSAPARRPQPRPVVPNLLEISSGAAVVSRTAEAVLEASAAKAIDGDSHTMWVTPPRDPKQTIVLSLPARARIEQVGVRNAVKQNLLASGVQIELSVDGKVFTPVTTLTPVIGETAQLVRIPPSVARFVRVNLLGAKGDYIQIGSIYAVGSLLDPVNAAPLDGCFAVNGFPAAFVQKGAQVVGEVGTGKVPTLVDGGSDGRFYRFAWIRGPEYGLAAVSITPDGRHIDGIVWHEEALQMQQFVAPDWLGDRVDCGGVRARATDVVFRDYVQRQQHFPLFGLRFDESGKLIDAESSATLGRVTAFLSANPNLPVRFVAHELLHSTPEQNQRIAQARIESLRDALSKTGVKLAHVTFVAVGADKPRRDAAINLTRAMYSSVDLELAVAR